MVKEQGKEGRKIRRKHTIVGLLLACIVILILGTWYMTEQTDNSSTIDFHLKDLDGNEFSLKSFQGKVVVVNFMATWCSICRLEMAHFSDLWEYYGDSIIILFVDIDPLETEDILRPFAEHYGREGWIWSRDTANLAQTVDIAATPTTIIFDKKGEPRFKHVGLTDVSTFIQGIDRLLSE